MTQILLPLIFVLAFLAVAIFAQGVASGVIASRARTQRVNRRMTLLASGMAHKEVYEALVRQRRAPDIRNASVLNFYKLAQTRLSQAGFNLSPISMLGIWLVAATVLWLVAILILVTTGSSVGVPEMIMSLVGSLMLTGTMVIVVISFRRNRRLRIFEDQLPLALDIVVRSLRAGHPVVSALQLVTSEMGDPIGSEFGLIVDETTYGFELREALANLARRTGSQDAHFFAVSVSAILSGVHSPPSSPSSMVARSSTFLVRMQPWLAARTSLLKRLLALVSWR